MKVCTKCKEEKSLSGFSKDKGQKSGIRPECKNCQKEFQKQLHKNYPWLRPLRNAKGRCNNPKNKKFNDYGGRGIKFLLKDIDGEYLWNRDKGWLLKNPSIDRIDNDGDYTLENCRFIEFSENSAKDKRKPILQYDLNGNFIREYKSIMDAQRKTGISNKLIGRVVLGKRKQTHEYIWRYKKEFINE